MLRDIVAGAVPCPLQHPPHRFNLTLSDVVTGRTHEFRQSLRALGVQDGDIYETGWSDIEPLKNYPAFKLKLRELIVGYERKVLLIDKSSSLWALLMSPCNYRSRLNRFAILVLFLCSS